MHVMTSSKMEVHVFYFFFFKSFITSTRIELLNWPVKCQAGIYTGPTIDQIHKSHNATIPYPTMLHSKHKCVHFCSEWSIVGYGTGAFWNLWIRSIDHHCVCKWWEAITRHTGHQHIEAETRWPPWLQTTFSNAFSWMKIVIFQIKFHWSLFLRVQLTICQHWFR